MKNSYIIIALVIIGLVIGGFALVNKSSVLGGSFFSATNSVVAVTTTTSTVALAANPGRQYASIYNNGSVTVYLSFAGASTAGKGIGLPASQRYEIGLNNLFTGPVYVSTVSGTSTLSIVEK